MSITIFANHLSTSLKQDNRFFRRASTNLHKMPIKLSLLLQEFTYFVLVLGFKPDSWRIFPSVPGWMMVPSFRISSLVMT